MALGVLLVQIIGAPFQRRGCGVCRSIAMCGPGLPSEKDSLPFAVWTVNKQPTAVGSPLPSGLFWTCLISTSSNVTLLHRMTHISDWSLQGCKVVPWLISRVLCGAGRGCCWACMAAQLALPFSSLQMLVQSILLNKQSRCPLCLRVSRAESCRTQRLRPAPNRHTFRFDLPRKENRGSHRHQV